MPLARELLQRFHAAAAEDVLVRDQVVVDNLRRIRLIAALLLPIFVLACALLLPGAWPERAGAVSWKLAVGLTHFTGFCMASTCCALAHWALRRSPAGRVARALPGVVAVFTLAFGLVLTIFYQWVSPKTSPTVVTTLGVALVLYLRPPLAAVLYVAVAVLGFFALPLTQTDPLLLASGRVSMLVLPMVGMAFAMLNWRKNTVNVLLTRSLALANATLVSKQAELERLAWYDGLTGLCNRSEFMRRADRELSRALRHRHPTTLLLLDLDHFKRVNDHYGHPIGDAALCHVANVLAQTVRTTDLVARLGGEEFIVLLPQTRLDAALQCAEKLRLAVQDQPLAIEAGGVLPITVSVGVVEVPPEGGVDMLVAYAAIDRALYRAKAAGRNCVEVAGLEEGFHPSQAAELAA